MKFDHRGDAFRDAIVRMQGTETSVLPPTFFKGAQFGAYIKATVAKDGSCVRIPTSLLLVGGR